MEIQNKSAAILDKYWDCGTYFGYQSVKDENISENQETLFSEAKQ